MPPNLISPRDPERTAILSMTTQSVIVRTQVERLGSLHYVALETEK
jgi:hypothetical protein